MQEQRVFTDYKLQLRDRILSTAMTAFSSGGIKATKMDDIASLMSISKRTLYEIYDNKETLLFECIRNYHTVKNRELNEYMKQPGRDVLDIVIYLYRNSIREAAAVKPTFYEELGKYPQILEYLNEQKQRKHDEFLRFMLRGIREGYFRKDLNYDIISHVFQALGTYMHREHLYEHYTFEDLFFNMLFITLRGFCTAKGINKLDLAMASVGEH